MMVEGRDFTTGDLVRLAGLRAKQRGQACAIWRNVWRSLAEHGEQAYIDINFTYLDKDGHSQRVTDEKSFANALRDLHSDFELMTGIAHVGKHLEIRAVKHPGAPVSAANTYVTTPGFDQAAFENFIVTSLSPTFAGRDATRCRL